MFIKNIQWYSIAILMVTHLSLTETISSSTESTETPSKSGNSSEFKNASYESEWRSNDTNEPSHPTDKIYSIDLATFHKHRRNGMENFPTNEDHRRYFMDFPSRNQFDNDQPYYRERNRYNDDIYPVRVQSCPHYMRDVSRFQNDGGQNGILQGWLGGTQWRGKNEEDKQYPYTSSYITTATAKMPASYNRHQGTYSSKYSNTREKTAIPVKPRIYDSEYRSESQDNNPRNYFNNRNRDYNDYRNMHPWGSSSQSDRNNRVIYYEYNLDHRKPDNSFQYQRGLGYNCRSGFGSPPCEQEMYGRGNFEDRNYPSSDEHIQSRVPAQSKSSAVLYDDDTEPQFGDYIAGKSHRFRYPDRSQHSMGRGYVFSLDLPRDRQQMPGSAPSVYMSQYPFGQAQFVDDYKYDSASKSAPFVHA